MLVRSLAVVDVEYDCAVSVAETEYNGHVEMLLFISDEEIC